MRKGIDTMSFVNKIKEDINNIRVLIQDHNYKPFWRPVLLIVLVFFLFYYLNNNAKDKVIVIQKKIEAQQAEADNEKEYNASKTRYQNLLAKLPPAAQKNEWILLQLEAIANNLKIRDVVNFAKGANSSYGIFEISTAEITGNLTYNQLGRLVETIENNPQFLRINKLTLNRRENTETIAVKIEVYTAFLEDHKVVSNSKGGK